MGLTSHIFDTQDMSTDLHDLVNEVQVVLQIIFLFGVLTRIVSKWCIHVQLATVRKRNGRMIIEGKVQAVLFQLGSGRSC